MKVVAGKSVGFPDSKIMLEDENGGVKPFEVRGHWLYVRKCKRAEEMGGILIPEKTRSDTVFALILAKGTECGKKLTAQDRRIYDPRGTAVVNELEIYDKIMCPDDHHRGIQRSPWGEEEFFIHECIVKCVVEN